LFRKILIFWVVAAKNYGRKLLILENQQWRRLFNVKGLQMKTPILEENLISSMLSGYIF